MGQDVTKSMVGGDGLVELYCPDRAGPKRFQPIDARELLSSGNGFLSREEMEAAKAAEDQGKPKGKGKAKAAPDASSGDVSPAQASQAATKTDGDTAGAAKS